MQMVAMSDWRQNDLSRWFEHNRHPSVYNIFYKDKHEKFRGYTRDMEREGRMSYDERAQCLAYHEQHESSPTTIAYVPSLTALLGKNIPVPIIVEPTAYRPLDALTGLHRAMDDGDLHFLLRHHEFQHADDIYNGIPLRDGTLLDHTLIKDIHPLHLELLFESRADIAEMRARLAQGSHISPWFVRNRNFIFSRLQQSHDMYHNRLYKTPFELQAIIDVHNTLYELLPAIPGHEAFRYRRRRR
jgi:hypothetical protein